MSLAAVTAYFNPCGWKSRRRNLDMFLQAWQGCPIFVVEQGEQQQVPDSLLCTSGDIMWQKERMLNLGLQHLAKLGYDNLMWVDADILWHEVNWADKVQQALEKHDIVQCFSTLTRNFSDGPRYYPYGSMASFAATGFFKGPPGGAWAIKASLLEHVSLYEHRILGGGDSAFIRAIGFQPGTSVRMHLTTWGARRWPALQKEHYSKWLLATSPYLCGRAGFVEQSCEFMQHGSARNRQYGYRRDLLLRNFNPAEDVIARPNKLLEWANDKHKLHEAVEQYFYSRREDD